jgi:hypothetical protein
MKLNLQMFKYHTLGDYVKTIHERGTTDNYTTQLVQFLVRQGSSLMHFVG